jgi:hypothetical protein
LKLLSSVGVGQKAVVALMMPHQLLPASAGSVAPQRGAGMAVDSKMQQWVMLFTHGRSGLSQMFYESWIGPHGKSP